MIMIVSHSTCASKLGVYDWFWWMHLTNIYLM